MSRPTWLTVITTISTIAVLILHYSTAQSGIDAKTRLKLKLRKPDIVDIKFINAGNWRYAMRNQGSFMYDSPDSDGDGNNAGGIFPRGSDVSIVFAAGAWIGALKNGIPVVSETQFGTEFQPGQILNSGLSFYDLEADSVNNPNNRVYVIDQTRSGTDWDQWPQEAGLGANGDPALIADQQTWAVFNDLDTTLSQEGTLSSPSPGLGLEVTLESFVFDKPILEDAVILKYTITNKTNTSYPGAYFGLWMDADVDVSGNDLIGSDSIRGLGYVYNVDNSDTPLAVGLDFLQGPVVNSDSLAPLYAMKFQHQKQILTYDPSNNQYIPRTLGGDSVLLRATSMFDNTKDFPHNNYERYNMLRGLTMSGQIDAKTRNGWYFPGNPIAGSGLIDRTPTEKRILLSTGPFRVEAGSTQEIWAAVVGGRGSDHLDAVSNLFVNDDILQSLMTTGLGLHLFDVPAPEFHATAGDGFVTLAWDTTAEAMIHPYAMASIIDTANGYSDALRVYDFQGYRIYRSLTGLEGHFTRIAQFDKIDSLNTLREWYLNTFSHWESRTIDVGHNTGLVYSYTDHDVTSLHKYFYAVTAYGAQPEIVNHRYYYKQLTPGYVSPIPLNLPILRESPIHGHIIKVTPQAEIARKAGDLSLIRVVPNPYIIRSDEGRQIKFTGLPARCTMRIFTVAGDLVKTLIHNTASNNHRVDETPHDDNTEPVAQETSTETWNLRNENNYLIASGVYIAHIHSSLGDKIVKFAVIR